MFPQELRLFPEPVRRFRDKDTQPVAHSCIRLVIDVAGDGRTYDRGLVELPSARRAVSVRCETTWITIAAMAIHRMRTAIDAIDLSP